MREFLQVGTSGAKGSVCVPASLSDEIANFMGLMTLKLEKKAATSTDAAEHEDLNFVPSTVSSVAHGYISPDSTTCVVK